MLHLCSRVSLNSYLSPVRTSQYGASTLQNDSAILILSFRIRHPKSTAVMAMTVPALPESIATTKMSIKQEEAKPIARMEPKRSNLSEQTRDLLNRPYKQRPMLSGTTGIKSLPMELLLKVVQFVSRVSGKGYRLLTPTVAAYQYAECTDSGLSRI